MATKPDKWVEGVKVKGKKRNERKKTDKSGKNHCGNDLKTRGW